MVYKTSTNMPAGSSNEDCLFSITHEPAPVLQDASISMNVPARRMPIPFLKMQERGNRESMTTSPLSGLPSTLREPRCGSSQRQSGRECASNMNLNKGGDQWDLLPITPTFLSHSTDAKQRNRLLEAGNIWSFQLGQIE